MRRVAQQVPPGAQSALPAQRTRAKLPPHEDTPPMFFLQLPKPGPPFASRIQQHVVLPLMHVSLPQTTLPGAAGVGVDGVGGVGDCASAAGLVPASFDAPGVLPEPEAPLAPVPLPEAPLACVSSSVGGDPSSPSSFGAGAAGSPAVTTSFTDEHAITKNNERSEKDIQAAAFTARAPSNTRTVRSSPQNTRCFAEVEPTFHTKTVSEASALRSWSDATSCAVVASSVVASSAEVASLGASRCRRADA